MLKNYFKIAVRNIIRHKGFSFINIAGLAVGLAVCFLILLWVQDELSFDKFNENYNRIHRILVDVNTNGEKFVVGVTAAAIAPNIIDDVPEFEEICRFKNWGRFQIRKNENEEFVGLNSGVADPSIFKIFTIPLLAGDPETALNDAHSLVLTTEAAEKLFGEDDPLGKIVQVKNRGDFTVTGLVDNIENSHFNFEFLAPFHLIKEDGENIDDMNMGSFNFTTYVLLSENTDPKIVDGKIKDFYFEEDSEFEPILFLQSLKDIYLNSDAAYDFTMRGDIKTIYIFSFIALLVLLIACINFMNLSTAKSAARAREIGIRKVSGSSRSKIVFQFFLESVMYAFLGMAIALLLTELLLPVFNEISGKEITLNFTQSYQTILLLVGITLITGLISGIYPALLLSSFKPVNVLKSTIVSGKKASLFRTILVISQFSLSIILLISALTVHKQLKFIYNKDLGYNKHHLVYSFFSPTLKDKYEVIKESLLNMPDVTAVTNMDVLPVYECPASGVNDWEGRVGDDSFQLHMINIEHDFLKTFEIELLEGRNFTANTKADSNCIILNEEAVRRMGMEDPIGKYVYEENIRIIGVVKDFNYNTVRGKIEPLAIISGTSRARYFLARINSANTVQTLEKMDALISSIDPDIDWNFRFFDETLENLYQTEQNAGRLITYFTILAIFISCLGLFGLAGYITERRTKEIGIRKVMGASVTGITVLLTKEFCKWVIISIIIAWPVAYYLMEKWLQNFAYKTEIGALTFIISGCFALLIAVVTVSFQTIRTAISNPVEALKYE
ncbi:MAG: FtsX-like permease family protein [Candidatus Cloacimonetes bacterium]|nr:FtsX-like permease family protein [Candidatus Cloacimonadota bacterium]